MYIVVGLGNPGEQYAHTRHNTGRLAIEYLEKKELSGVRSIHLDTFMNKSGVGVAKIIKSKKAAQKLIVIYDDLDLGLGTLKIS
ncbi:MAG: aminoacyl-tRNA hydrolase, partial [Minisyncoccia bacterium]